MNKAFINYTTGAAFFLQLSKAQVRALIGLAAIKGSVDEITNAMYWKSTSSLLYKGLIIHAEKGYTLTEAGKLVVKLLEEAGLVNLSRKQAIPKSLIKNIHKELQDEVPT